MGRLAAVFWNLGIPREGAGPFVGGGVVRVCSFGVSTYFRSFLNGGGSFRHDPEFTCRGCRAPAPPRRRGSPTRAGATAKGPSVGVRVELVHDETAFVRSSPMASRPTMRASPGRIRGPPAASASARPLPLVLGTCASSRPSVAARGSTTVSPAEGTTRLGASRSGQDAGRPSASRARAGSGPRRFGPRRRLRRAARGSSAVARDPRRQTLHDVRDDAVEDEDASAGPRAAPPRATSPALSPSLLSPAARRPASPERGGVREVQGDAVAVGTERRLEHDRERGRSAAIRDSVVSERVESRSSTKRGTLIRARA